MVPLVLIVEDDHSTHCLLEAVLRHHGIGCDHAVDGDAALAKIAECDYGAVLLDLLLPGTDGFAVLRKVRQTRPHVLPRVIVITAAADAVWRGCEEIPLVKCVLRKPLDINELADHVRACLSEASVGRQA